jgi:hypothetical protein
LWDHALDRLHDGLEPSDIEVQIEILNDSITWFPSIEHFRSLDGLVSARAVLRRCPGRTHHADAVSLNDWVPADVARNLRVVFDGVSIGGRS